MLKAVSVIFYLDMNDCLVTLCVFTRHLFSLSFSLELWEIDIQKVRFNHVHLENGSGLNGTLATHQELLNA